MKNTRERFAEYVIKSDGCWTWTGPRSTTGYGVMGLFYKHVRAHRISWELHRGPIPDGLFVLHRCDNRVCVNPEHLWLGTQRENIIDAYSKGRIPLETRSKKGSDNPWAKLTEDAAREIRRARAEGETTVALAARFNTTKKTISSIALRKSWTHI